MDLLEDLKISKYEKILNFSFVMTYIILKKLVLPKKLPELS